MILKFYVQFRTVYLNCRFSLRKLIYKLGRIIDTVNTTRQFSLLLTKTILQQILFMLVLRGMLFVGDSALLPIIETKLLHAPLPNLTLELTTDIVIGGMSIAGVILGLYCSNIASIYATKYANAPTNLARLFQRDIITRKCIKEIVGYIIFSIILLGECVFQSDTSLFSMVFLLLYSIRIIVVFSIAGNRSNTLSNTYQISESLYADIESAFRYISSKRFQASDKSFQQHYQRICIERLKDLKDIAVFNKANPANQNAAMLWFMCDNLSLVRDYWMVKGKIKHDSLWYRDKVQYKSWHLLSSDEIDIALKTSTSPGTEIIRDYWWLESDIEKVNEICFEKLCRDGDFATIYQYISAVGKISKYAINSGDLNAWIRSIKQMRNKFVSCCPATPASEEETRIIAAICEVFTTVYVSMVIGINECLKSWSLQDILDDAVKLSFGNNADVTKNVLYNTKDIEALFHRVSVEMKLNGKGVTPDWYIRQNVSKHIIHYFNNIVTSISTACDEILQFGVNHLEKEQYLQAGLVFSQLLQLMTKLELTVDMLEQDFDLLQKQHIEPSIVLEESKLPSAQQRLDDIKERLPRLLAKCCGSFALAHWTNREDYPDLLGLCYNHTCEVLITSIEKNDYELFNESYTGFLLTMLLYQEYIRTDVVEAKTNLQDHIVIHALTAPIIEYALISGFAILWGELTNAPQWAQLVKAELRIFMEKDPDHANALRYIAEMASTVQKSPVLQFGNRWMIHLTWNRRIEDAICQSSLCEFEYEKFGQEVLKTNSKLVQIFCSSISLGVGFLHHVEEIYFICCANDYLPPDMQYKGNSNWEERLNETEDV